MKAADARAAGRRHRVDVGGTDVGGGWGARDRDTGAEWRDAGGNPRADPIVDRDRCPVCLNHKIKLPSIRPIFQLSLGSTWGKSSK